MAKATFWHRLRHWSKVLGPGFVTGASDDDPSGIATYSQTGAQFGYTQLWTMILTIPLMTGIQEMCGRIGLVTGKGIAGVIRKHYNPTMLWMVIALLVAANTVNLSANLGAMAAAIQLLFPVSYKLTLLAVTAGSILLVVLIPYKTYANLLKYLTLSLFAYVIATFSIRQDWMEVFRHAILPQIEISSTYWLNIVAILGTTISPYLFFWQANQEVEEEVSQKKLRSMGIGKPRITIRDIRHLRVDTTVGMIFSNLIALFIMITTASTLHQEGITTITSAPEAAAALKPFAGEFASILFTLGIVGTGLLSIPVLAGSIAYALAEAFRQKEGLYRPLAKARFFYGAIIIATVIGMIINFLHVEPFRLLYYAAIFNGLCTPPLLIMIVLIANNREIMGRHANSSWSNLGAIVLTVLMTAATGLLVAQIL